MRRESIATHVLPDGSGPDVVYYELRLADLATADLEAWVGNFGGSNVYIFEGRLSLADCQGRFPQGGIKGRVDCLMGLPAGGKAGVCGISEDAQSLTIFFEGANSSGQYQSVTTRVIEKVRE